MNPLPLTLFSLLLLAPVADGWLGVYLVAEREEAVVSEVIPGSPAAKAGMQTGDVLLAVGDKATPTRDEFVAAIRAQKAGDRLRIKLRRGEQESTVVVKLGERAPDAAPAPAPAPSSTLSPKKPSAPAQPGAESTPKEPARATAKMPYLGLSVRSTEGGVVIDRVVPQGPADGAVLAPGDRITSLAEQPVASLADIDRILAQQAPGRKVAVGVQGNDGVRSIMITLGERVATGQPSLPAPAATDAAKAAPAPTPERSSPPAKDTPDIAAEIDALRQELRDLRRQLEDLRRQKGW